MRCAGIDSPYTASIVGFCSDSNIGGCSFLEYDAAAEERFPDLSVSWQEEVEGERLLFEEAWFLADESGLEELQLYGTFWITAESVTTRHIALPGCPPCRCPA